MAEDSPYIIYVDKSQTYENALEPDISNDAEVYGDAEYLDFSTEEVGSNSENENVEYLDDAEILDSTQSIFKRENSPPAPFKWNHTTTVHLIEAYQVLETSLISGELTIHQVWDKVAKRLQLFGSNVTPTQCKNKFVGLKQIYEKMKEQEIKSGVSVKKWMYMDQMEPIMTQMEKYTSYSGDSWDSPKLQTKLELGDEISLDDNHKSEKPVQGIYKWENPAILYLIAQYRKYQSSLESGSISHKVLYRLVEKNMQKAGYKVTATQCMVKIHSLKKTYKNVKEYNQVNRLIPRRWKYYDLVDSIVQGTTETSDFNPLEEESETLAEINSNETTTPSNIFKWNRKAIEILVTAYRDQRPALVERYPLRGSKTSQHRVWQNIVQRLHKAGFDVSMGQCKSKIAGMLKLYRRKKSGSVGRVWGEKGNWYTRLIESLVDKPVKLGPREVPIKIGKSENLESNRVRRADNILDQLVICEENRERRHQENREQRQQLINIMGQLLEKL